MNDSNDSLEYVIDDYLVKCNLAVDRLRFELSVEDLQHAVSKGISRSGTIKAFGGGEYSFHGNGCLVEAKDLNIDWDFTENLPIDAFDPWKVYSYMKYHPVFSISSKVARISFHGASLKENSG